MLGSRKRREAPLPTLVMTCVMAPVNSLAHDTRETNTPLSACARGELSSGGFERFAVQWPNPSIGVLAVRLLQRALAAKISTPRDAAA